MTASSNFNWQKVYFRTLWINSLRTVAPIPRFNITNVLFVWNYIQLVFFVEPVSRNFISTRDTMYSLILSAMANEGKLADNNSTSFSYTELTARKNRSQCLRPIHTNVIYYSIEAFLYH